MSFGYKVLRLNAPVLDDNHYCQLGKMDADRKQSTFDAVAISEVLEIWPKLERSGIWKTLTENHRKRRMGVKEISIVQSL